MRPTTPQVCKLFLLIQAGGAWVPGAWGSLGGLHWELAWEAGCWAWVDVSMASPTSCSHKSGGSGRCGLLSPGLWGSQPECSGAASALVSPLAGEVVYSGTYGDTCYYVNCSLECTLEFFNWSCPSTPTPTPSPSTPTSQESGTSTTPVPGVPGCPDLDPPRQVCVSGSFCCL